MNIMDNIFYSGDLAKTITQLFEIDAVIVARENVLDPRTGRTTNKDVSYDIKTTPLLKKKETDYDKISEADSYLIAEAKQLEGLNIDYQKSYFKIYGETKYEVVDFNEIYSGEKLVAIRFGVKK